MASPDGSRISPAASVTDGAGVVWTISYLFAQRNGYNTTAHASELLWWGGNVYVLGRNGHWWKLVSGNTWVDVGGDPSGQQPKRGFLSWVCMVLGGGQQQQQQPPGAKVQLTGQQLVLP